MHTLFPAISFLHGWEPRVWLLGGYHGPYESVFALPFLLALGENAAAVRLCGVFYSALTVVLSYFFLKRLGGARLLAWGGAMLLAISPSYTTAARVGMQKGAVVPFLLLAAMMASLLWFQRRDARLLSVAAAAWALALGCRLWVTAFMLACAAALWIAFPRVSRDVFRRRKDLLGALPLFLLIAGAPYLIENRRKDFISVRLLLLRHDTPGQQEPSLLRSLVQRTRDFHKQVRGTAYFHEQASPEWKTRLETDVGNRGAAAWFWGALALLLATRLARVREAPPAAVFFAFVIALTLALLAFSRTGHRLEHTYMLYPLVPFVMVLVFPFALRLARSSEIARAILAAMVVVSASTDVRLQGAYRRFLNEVGGFGEHSPALMGLSDHIRAHGFRRVYFPSSEPAMRVCLEFLSGWKLEWASVEPADIPQFDAFVARADRSTAFVRVDSWRIDRGYPLSAALNRYETTGRLQAVAFQTNSEFEKFVLYFKE